MFPTKTLKSAIDTYYTTLDRRRSQGQENEEALRLATSNLLSTLGQTVGWTIILEKRQLDRNCPDSIFEDDQNISRGQWEAKDTKDDLEKEIEKKREHNYPFINIIIGNPPYNAGQVNEHDNNKNREYPEIDQRVRETYTGDSEAQNRTALSDVYVKFFRWATDCLCDRDGIICFVSNNSFVDGIAFNGMRKHLVQDFTHIYHLNLGGNTRKGGGGSVFNIMVGVGITLLVRKRSSAQQGVIHYHAIDEMLSGSEKLALIKQWEDYRAIDWETLQPNDEYVWLTKGLRPEFKTFVPMGTKDAKAARDTNAAVLFKEYSNGVKTNRDVWVYNYQQKVLVANVRRFITFYNSEVDRWRRNNNKATNVDSFVLYEDKEIKWSSTLKAYLARAMDVVFNPAAPRLSLFRPFTRQYLYFNNDIVDRPGLFFRIFPTSATEEENSVIGVTGIGSERPFACLATNIIPNLMFIGGFGSATQCFPFYTYNEDGTNRTENITDWALTQFQARCGNDVTKWDIFYYIYAVLHHPVYREHYAKNLKRDLPRIPLPTGAEAFTTLASHGNTLTDLHIGYESVAEYDLTEISTEGSGNIWRVEKMHLSKDRTQIIINTWLTLDGIPPECFEYRLGNRSALEWVIDQYQIKTDKRSGIVNDPNREDEHNYIVNLVKRVVTVSVETVRIVGEIGRVEMGMRGD